ncbi:MAG TPA: hypothetical protein VN205_03365 [Thermomonas sp.]|nr:hypothetical protein [Thermomonas sp.]
MRTLSASALTAAFLLAALPAVPQRAEANTGVLRCQMPDGTSVYTNKACSAFGAKATPLSGEVLNRIERDQRHEARLTGVEPGESPLQPLQASVRRSPQLGCAGSPGQLAADLAASVAMRDVNRVAESFDWAGMQNAQAQRVMAKLETLSRQVVTDAEYFDATIGGQVMYADAGTAGDGAAGLMQVTFDNGDGTTVMDFDVQRDQGCYFLQY